MKKSNFEKKTKKKKRIDIKTRYFKKNLMFLINVILILDIN